MEVTHFIFSYFPCYLYQFYDSCPFPLTLLLLLAFTHISALIASFNVCLLTFASCSVSFPLNPVPFVSNSYLLPVTTCLLPLTLVSLTPESCSLHLLYSSYSRPFIHVSFFLVHPLSLLYDSYPLLLHMPHPFIPPLLNELLTFTFFFLPNPCLLQPICHVPLNLSLLHLTIHLLHPSHPTPPLVLTSCSSPGQQLGETANTAAT